jgi:putative phosphoesterase
MRVAVLGDIHGNALALEAVLAAIKRERVHTLLVTGDYVGYYRHAVEVLDLLGQWPYDRIFRVRGNHEDLLLKAAQDANFLAECNRRYGGALEAALAGLSDEGLQHLAELPARLDLQFADKRVILSHGSPWDTDQYIYPDAPAAVWQRLSDEGADFVFLGHTHYKMEMRLGRTVVVNPGSVGQPRDGHAGAAWALVDLNAGNVELFSEDYDWQSVGDEAARLDPHNPYLHEIFARTCRPS